MTTTDTVEDIEGLVAQMLRGILLKATVDRPSVDERETVSELFAKDTVNLVLTFIANNPSIMDGPIEEDPFTHAGPSTLQ